MLNRIFFGLVVCSTTAYALDVNNVEITSTNVFDITYELDGITTSTTDTQLEGFSVTLTPNNINCGDVFWPSIPGISSTPQGCGNVELSDGSMGLYVSTDSTPGSARNRDNLYIETFDGNTFWFKRRTTDCGGSAYTFTTHRDAIVLFDDGDPASVVGTGSGYICFDTETWDLPG
jgi:hypothetical protein